MFNTAIPNCGDPSMSFSYDLTTTLGKMRLLISDTDPTAPQFQDEELQAFQDVTSMQVQGPQAFFGGSSIPQGELLLLSCAQAMDALATKVASTHGQTYTIGDFSVAAKDQVVSLQGQGQKFRDAVYNLPAWGIIEENTCGFNELIIIRNWVLRTEL